MNVRDPGLAEQSARIALSSEIPPQVADLRLLLILHLAGRHQELSWTTLGTNSELLMAPYVGIAPLIISQYIPQIFWIGVPLADLETWVRAHVPAELSAKIEHGMEGARIKLAAKDILVPAADA